MAVSHGKKLIWSMPCKRQLDNNQAFDEWRFYGRRSGRKLNARRQQVIDTLLPKLSVPTDSIDQQGSLDPSLLFTFQPQKTILEIGFGNGERLAEEIKQNPENGYIGAEPFINGMSSFLCDIERQETLGNIRVLMDNAIPLVRSLKPSSMDTIYVLNPDPWHKKRHHNRRIINQDNLNHFSKILKSEGLLYMTTDVEPLAEWMITEAMRHPDFEWQVKSANDWRNPPPNWIPTRYETKKAKGAGKMNYLVFKKLASE